MDGRIQEILHEEVVALFQAHLSGMFGSIKTAMVEYFNERYAAIAETVSVVAFSAIAAVGGGAAWAFQYRESNNTNPPDFRWSVGPNCGHEVAVYVEGCFFTCSCPAD